MARISCLWSLAVLACLTTPAEGSPSEAMSPPVIVSPADGAVFTTAIGQTLVIDVVATDGDGDIDNQGILSHIGANMTPWPALSWDPSSCVPGCGVLRLRFVWSPAPGQEGVHAVNFTARDRQGHSSLVRVSIAVGSADLSITKTAGPDPVSVGDTVTYTITVANHGPDTARGVRVDETLVGNQTVFSATSNLGSGCSQAAAAFLTCQLGDLVAGAAATIVIDVSAGAPGSVGNTAHVMATTRDPNHANNLASAFVTVTSVVPGSGADPWAWGGNFEGQLGDGTTQGNVGAFGCCVAIPQPVSNLSDVVAVSAGGVHSLAVKADGTVWAWGNNSYGALGDGTRLGIPTCSFGGCRPTPAQVTGLTNVTEVAAGHLFSLALRQEGTVWSWGYNGHGQLGVGTSLYTSQLCGGPFAFEDCSTVPLHVTFPPNGPRIVALAAAVLHSLALGADGTVWAWGLNSRGQLGAGLADTSAIAMRPVQTPLADVVAVAADEGVGLAVKRDGTVWAWGNHQFGHLGSGVTLASVGCSPVAEPFCASPVPVQVAGLSGIVAVAAARDHSLALKHDGTVLAWGSNDSGQLGNGTRTGGTCPDAVSVCHTTPVPVVGLTDVVAIAAGQLYSLALKRDGTLWAWGTGQGSFGLLGGGTAGEIRTLPVQVINLGGIQHVSAGVGHVLATGSNVGTNIATHPEESGQINPYVTVTFGSLQQPGTTTVTRSGIGPNPPAGFSLGDPPVYYDVATTAAFTPPVTVCIDYTGLSFTGPPRLFHYEENPLGSGAYSWTDRTVSVDPARQIICAETESLSPFAIFSESNRPPAADAGPDRAFSCAPSGGLRVTLDGSGSHDPDGDPLTYEWTGPFPEGGGVVKGATAAVTLPPGTSVLTLVVSDGRAASPPAQITMTVAPDTVGPQLRLSLAPGLLWPANGKMVEVTASIDASDACDANPAVTLVSLTSSEPDDAIAGADLGTDDRRFSLRARRLGTGTGRVYTVIYRATDAAGNWTEASAEVVVPHDQRKR